MTRTSAPSTAVQKAAPCGGGHLPAVAALVVDGLVHEDRDGSLHRRGVVQPAVVVGIAEEVGVGADESPPGTVDDEAVAAPRVDEPRQPIGARAVLAVEADVVVAGDRDQRARQVGEHGAGERTVGGVVGVLVDDVAGEGDEVGRIGGDLAEQPAHRLG